MKKFRTASRNMPEDISKISYPGQPESHKKTATGFEDYLEALAIIDSEKNAIRILSTQNTMSALSDAILDRAEEVIDNNLPEEGQFSRVVVAMESPELLEDGGYKEGVELVVALWGKGMKSPVHGHAAGYMHEELLQGKLKVNNYRIVDRGNKIVRRLITNIIEGIQNVFVSKYSTAEPDALYSRELLVHNFEALETSASLHYLPEHTRDGRDNKYEVEEFSNTYRLGALNVTPLTAQEAIYLPAGEVALVRSEAVPEFGDHFIVYTGPPVMKPHGLRPQDEVIIASIRDSELLDSYSSTRGLVLLRLSAEARDLFLEFHGITIEKKVIFPKE